MPPKPVPIDLKNGEPHALKLTASALADAETRTGGRAIVSLLVNSQWGFLPAVAFLFAGLRWENPRLTWEEAGALVDHYLEEGGDLFDLAEPIIEAALEAKLLKRRKDDAPPDPPAGAES